MALANAGAWDTLHPSLSMPVLACIKDWGFSSMTPVQAAAIPPFLTHKDVCVEAATGSGKTLAFVVPLVEILLRRETPLDKHEVGAIVVEPTRELAVQVAEVVRAFCQRIPQYTLLLMTGGTDVSADVERFRLEGGNIVVATPGRLNDVMQRSGAFNVRELEVLVLDEADRLLDLGFLNTINSILERLPKQRRTGLFSATQASGLTDIARAGLRNAVKVCVRLEHRGGQVTQKTPSTLHNFFTICEQDEKLGQLFSFLLEHRGEKIMVFFLTCACVDYFGKVLEHLMARQGISVLSLHGKMVPKKRTGTYTTFTNLTSGVLVCTDVAARGLDIPDVHWIIQYDPPQDPDFFVHRVGRTARMGREGKALVYLTPKEDTYVEFLSVRKVPLTKIPMRGNVTDPLPEVVELSLSDRDVFDKGLRAIVSYVRAYSEHRCNHIFRFAHMDMGRLARSFALLRLPKMPELRGKKIDFVETTIDTDTIPYKDTKRERARQVRLTAARVERDERARKRTRRHENPPSKRLQESVKAKQEEPDDNEDDWEELARETRLLKKLRRKRITQEEFDRAMGDQSENEDAKDEVEKIPHKSMPKGSWSLTKQRKAVRKERREKRVLKRHRRK